MSRLHCKVNFEMQLIVPVDRLQMVVDWLERQGDLMGEWGEAEVEVVGEKVTFDRIEWVGPAKEVAHPQNKRKLVGFVSSGRDSK